MILADKIIENRKKNGWSQEELAEKLGVSRQSVSKWEGAQAIPDIKKILLMADLFNVSTDYLLKDDIEAEEHAEIVPVDNGLEEQTRSVSMEEAVSFLAFNEKAAVTVSRGVMLCILSPILVILLGGLAEIGMIDVNPDMAAMFGTIILLVIVASAVAMFLMTGMKGKQYEYLENVNIDTEYGVSGMVREKMTAYAERHSRLLVIGIMLCVVAAIPLLMMEFMKYSNNTDLYPIIGVVVLLTMVAVGVRLIVLTCMRQGGFDRLLEEGDYTRLNKLAGKYDGVYWAIATAVYLIWSFVTQRWDLTWIVWPVAGVLFAAYKEIMKAIVRAKNS